MHPKNAVGADVTPAVEPVVVRQPSEASSAQEVVATIGVGGNLGDAHATVLWALQALRTAKGISQLQTASLYASAPIDSSGPDYINTVVSVHTTLDAHTLLAVLHKLENEAGRLRPYRNAPRTLDLDLLLYGDAHINTPTLQVPHPRMWQRAFVLYPLAELSPELVSEEMLLAVKDQAIGRLEAV